MLSEVFIRHFAKACVLCYRLGAVDIATSRDESDLERLKENTKYPNMYGTISNSTMEWNEWRFFLISLLKDKNEFTAELDCLKGNKCVESIILRVCQQFYNHGVEDYVVCGMPMSAASVKSLSGAFEFKKGGYKRISRDRIVKKMQVFLYERMGLDNEFIKDYCGSDIEKGRKSHALSKTSYDKFSRMLWLAIKKEAWYEL